MEAEGIFVGIDVAKVQVDVAARPTDDRWTVSNDGAGIGQLTSYLKALEPTLMLLEASGGLELPLVAALATEEIPVVVVNPRQVRDFAHATGRLAKTDLLPLFAMLIYSPGTSPSANSLGYFNASIFLTVRQFTLYSFPSLSPHRVWDLGASHGTSQDKATRGE